MQNASVFIAKSRALALASGIFYSQSGNKKAPGSPAPCANTHPGVRRLLWLLFECLLGSSLLQDLQCLQCSANFSLPHCLSASGLSRPVFFGATGF
jgi:hypothetical protein